MAYIDKDLLLKDIGESVVFSVRAGYISPELRGARKIIDRIENAPTADVQEVKHGEWENVVEQELYCPDVKTTITTTTQTCSNCKIRTGFIGPKRYIFDHNCPNCGAKMDGGKTK